MTAKQEATGARDANDADGSLIERFNPFLPEFRADPYPFYHQLRSHDPVHWGLSPSSVVPGCWYLTRYADVVAALRDPRLGREVRRALPPETFTLGRDGYNAFGETARRFMLFRDPPEHTRLRTLVNQAFTPRMVQRLSPRIEEITNDLLDNVRSPGTMDVIADFAFPLPVTVIAEMLGVRPEDREQFKNWADNIVAGMDLRETRDSVARASRATLELTEYLRDVITELRRHPQDDLLSDLIAAEEQGGKLTEEEVLATCILLLIAGHETTVNLIGNGMLALLSHPDQMELLRGKPDLIQAAIEEFLRYESPAPVTFRIAFDDVEIGGKTIRKGESVGIMLAAANRDPEQFPDPDRLDIARTENRQIAFGHGIHFCLGAALARFEGRIAINTLLRRLPGLELQAGALEWRENIVLRGLKALPVSS